jgi:hypothetical protein
MEQPIPSGIKKAASRIQVEGAGQPGGDSKLSRRDWILLPLLGLLTIGFLAGATELAARRIFNASNSILASCMVLDDPTTGARAIPNSVCYEKVPEGSPIQYAFNSCGHRAGMECGPKPPGTYRIVTTGSSFTLGEQVAREDSFAALLPSEILRKTGQKVEVYNEGMGWGFSHSVALRFNKTLAAQPDIILWVLTPADIEGAAEVSFQPKVEAQRRSMSLLARAWYYAKNDFASQSAAEALSELVGRTRTATLLRHYLFQSPSLYMNSYLLIGDMDGGFLKTGWSDDWKRHLRQFEADDIQNSARAKAAHVPLVVTLVPSRGQAAMISMGKWPKDFDPYKLDRDLRAIVESHGGIYIDILPDFENVVNAGQYYYPVDTHPTAAGHALIARLLAKELTSGAVPGLHSGSQPQAALEQER